VPTSLLSSLLRNRRRPTQRVGQITQPGESGRDGVSIGVGSSGARASQGPAALPFWIGTDNTSSSNVITRIDPVSHVSMPGFTIPFQSVGIAWDGTGFWVSEFVPNGLVQRFDPSGNAPWLVSDPRRSGTGAFRRRAGVRRRGHPLGRRRRAADRDRAVGVAESLARPGALRRGNGGTGDGADLRSRGRPDPGDPDPRICVGSGGAALTTDRRSRL